LSNEYKNYVLKSKEWLENSNRKKEEWNIEKSKLEEKIRELNEKLADSNALSPEMLSPDETAQLVLGIFKRSSRDSLIVQLLQQNQEFMENLQSLLEADSPRIARHMTYTGNSYEVEASLASARSYSRPKSVDVDLQGRPPRSNHKLASPISISQNYSPDNFVFPYGNYFSST
jgi:predicted  nucleic acid-binding Zn-ribbon protein